MRFRLQRRKKIPRRKIAIAVFAVVFFIFFIFGVMVPQSMTGFTHAFAEPFWHIQPVVRAEVRGILKLFGSRGTLVAENTWLTAQLENARLALLDYDVIYEENQQLQELLGYTIDTNTIAAGVLVHPHASPYDTLIIDIGSAQGLSVGDRVFASDRVLIGSVAYVESDTARVELLSSPGVQTPVVLEESDVTLDAVGRGGGNILIEAPRDVAVAVGEHIQIPGAVTFVIGTVSSVESHPADATQDILFRLPVNIYTLQDVFIEAL